MELEIVFVRHQRSLNQDTHQSHWQYGDEVEVEKKADDRDADDKYFSGSFIINCKKWSWEN